MNEDSINEDVSLICAATYRVKQPQLQGEYDPVRHFDEPIHLLHVFEPFQM